MGLGEMGLGEFGQNPVTLPVTLSYGGPSPWKIH